MLTMPFDFSSVILSTKTKEPVQKSQILLAISCPWTFTLSEESFRELILEATICNFKQLIIVPV